MTPGAITARRAVWPASLCAALIATAVALARGLTPLAPAPVGAGLLRFDSVSIRRVVACDPMPDRSIGGRAGGAGVPGRLDVCGTVGDLIWLAHTPLSVRGTVLRTAGRDGSPWAMAEAFEIHARAAPGTPAAVLHGPMLQALLVEHFGDFRGLFPEVSP